MTEKLFTGTLNHNQNKTNKSIDFPVISLSVTFTDRTYSQRTQLTILDIVYACILMVMIYVILTKNMCDNDIVEHVIIIASG